MSQSGETSGTFTIANRYRAELPSILIGLAILGAAWWFLKLDLLLVGAFAVCILIPPAFPPRYLWVAKLAGYGGLSALSYFYYHNTQFAMLFGVAAIVFSAVAYFSKGRL